MCRSKPFPVELRGPVKIGMQAVDFAWFPGVNKLLEKEKMSLAGLQPVLLIPDRQNELGLWEQMIQILVEAGNGCVGQGIIFFCHFGPEKQCAIAIADHSEEAMPRLVTKYLQGFRDAYGASP